MNGIDNIVFITLLGILLIVLRKAWFYLIGNSFGIAIDCVIFGLWSIIWVIGIIFWLYIWPFRKVLQFIGFFYRLLLQRLSRRKRQILDSKLIPSVFNLVDTIFFLWHALKEKGFSVRRVWRETGFTANMRAGS
jgi:hypothetical protein